MPEFSAGGEVWVTLHMMHEAENAVLKVLEGGFGIRLVLVSLQKAKRRRTKGRGVGGN